MTDNPISIREILPSPPLLGDPLFMDYLRGKPNALRWFNGPPGDIDNVRRIAARVAERAYPRQELAATLGEYNAQVKNAPEAMANIARLGENGCLAVVTGQQAGLLTGPLYTLYKALSAIRLARNLSQTLVPFQVVPVFWIAADDHDLGEINHLSVPHRAEGRTTARRVRLPMETDGTPAGKAEVPIKDWNAMLEALRALLPESGRSLEDWVPIPTDPVRPVRQFAKTLARLFGHHGLILCEPSTLAPLFAETLGQILTAPNRIADTLSQTATELTGSGYHPTIEIEDDFTGLFLLQEGRRTKLRSRTELGRNTGTTFASNNTEICQSELKSLLAQSPHRFSGNVLVRPLLQDVVFPNVSYVAGPAEVCYFAQLRSLYEEFNLEMPAIVPRFSATLLDGKSRKTLEKGGYALAGLDPLSLPDTSPDLSSTSEAQEKINGLARTVLGRLTEWTGEVVRMDPTQERPFNKTIGRIEQDLAKLSRRAAEAVANAQGIGTRQWDSLLATVRPAGQLQERTFNISYIIARHGSGFLDDLAQKINPLKFEHQWIVTD